MPYGPCMRCDQQFKGDAHNVYLTVWRKNDRVQFRYVVCPECELALVEEWLLRALHKDSDGDWVLGGEDLVLDVLWLESLPWDSVGIAPRKGGNGHSR